MVAKRAILVALSILLVIALLGSTVVVGLDRGVMNDDYVTDGLEDTDVYSEIQSELVGGISDNLGDASQDLPGDIQVSQIVEDTMTEEFLQSQIEEAISSIYAFIHGDADSIEMVITVDELTDNLEDAISTQMAQLSLADFGIEPITLDVGEESVTVDIPQLDQGEQAYQTEVDSFEAEIKELIAEELEEEYGEEPTDEQVQAAYDDLIDELRDDILQAVEATVAAAGLEHELEVAAYDLGETITDAYTTDLSHSEFEAQLQADKEGISKAAVDFVMAEIPDDFEEIDLGEQLDEDELQPIVTISSTIGLLTLVLPLLSLGLIGLMYVGVRDVVTVGKAVGLVAIIAGVIAFAVATFLPGVLEDIAEAEMAAQENVEGWMVDFTLDVVGMVFAPIQTNAIALLGIGGLVLLGSVAYGRHRAGIDVPILSTLFDDGDGDTVQSDD